GGVARRAVGRDHRAVPARSRPAGPERGHPLRPVSRARRRHELLLGQPDPRLVSEPLPPLTGDPTSGAGRQARPLLRGHAGLAPAREEPRAPPSRCPANTPTTDHAENPRTAAFSRRDARNPRARVETTAPHGDRGGHGLLLAW